MRVRFHSRQLALLAAAALLGTACASADDDGSISSDEASSVYSNAGSGEASGTDTSGETTTAGGTGASGATTGVANAGAFCRGLPLRGFLGVQYGQYLAELQGQSNIEVTESQRSESQSTTWVSRSSQSSSTQSRAGQWSGSQFRFWQGFRNPGLDFSGMRGLSFDLLDVDLDKIGSLGGEGLGLSVDGVDSFGGTPSADDAENVGTAQLHSTVAPRPDSADRPGSILIDEPDSPSLMGDQPPQASQGTVAGSQGWQGTQGWQGGQATGASWNGNLAALCSMSFAEGEIAGFLSRISQAEMEHSRYALGALTQMQMRQYAETMISHHTQVTREMQAMFREWTIESTEGSLTRYMDQLSDQAMSHLEQVRGAGFDRQYIMMELQSHWTVLQMLNQIVWQVGDREFQCMVEQIRALVQQHYEMAMDLYKALDQVGAGSSQGASGAQGSQGSQGAQGAQGTLGSRVIQGAIGSRVIQGSVDSNAWRGVIGAQGGHSTLGTRGTQGSAGQGYPSTPSSSQGWQGGQGLGGDLDDEGPLSP